MLTKADINLVRSLARKEARRAEGLFVAEGAKLVGEALASGWRVERVFATAEGAAAIPHAPLPEPVGAKDMERLSHLKTPSGILALVRIPEHKLPADVGSALTLCLDGVQDPGNLGTIVRIADWFGIGDVVCSPGTADCFNPKVVQASMGAILRVRVHYAELGPVLEHAAGRGVPVYGTFLEGDDIYQSALTPAGIVVMGSEGGGISAAVAARVGRKLYIPPYPASRSGGSESLNVAVAAAVICSEFRRRA